MPELPEVETVRRGIEPHVVGRTIARVVVRDHRLRWPIEKALPKKLAGRTIVGTGRRAKYLLLPLDNGDRLIVHLGMSGRLWVLPQEEPTVKHDHVDVVLDRGQLLRFHDPRRFGAMLLWPSGHDSHALLENLGPEPFSPAFDGAYLWKQSRGRSVAVKNFVMDGRVVVGAGNIYAAEALFRAGVRPGRPAGRLKRAECDRLAQTIRDVLGEAIVQGGTTLRDFAGATGESGYFQQALFVYGRDGEPCRTCRTPIVRKVIGQRSSFHCPRCQK